MAHHNSRPTIRRSFGYITTETPYNADWVSAIKYVVPSAAREWENGVWTFDIRYYECVLEITKHIFGNNIIDSTGGIAEPQTATWRKAWDSWLLGSDERAKHQEYRRTQQRRKPEYGDDPYDVLFVKRDAPIFVIAAAYRSLAAYYHPDKPTGNEERMKAINAAYDKLKSSGAL